MAERFPCPVPTCDRTKPAGAIFCLRCWRRGTRALKHHLRATAAEARDSGAPIAQRRMAVTAYRQAETELIALVDGKLKADATAP